MNRILTGLCMLVLAGCSMLPGGDFRREEFLSVESEDTKISFDGAKTLWNTDDPVSVFYKSPENEIWTYSGSDGSASGTLKHFISSQRKETGIPIYAVYPYWEGATLNGTSVKTVIPSEVFPSPKPLLAAKSETQSLSFSYLSPVFRFTLEGPAEVALITLRGSRGEKIAGECEVDFSASSPSLSGATLSEITMTVPRSIAAGESVDFYFASAPTEFADGYEYVVRYADGLEEVFKVTGAISVEPGKMYVTLGSAISSEDPSIKILDVCFSDGVTRFFPTREGPFNFNEGMNGPYEYGGYEYGIFIGAGAAEKRITAGGGFRLKNGGYILLPAIPDYKLVKLTVGVKYELDMSVVPDARPSEKLEGTQTYIPANSLREFELEDTGVNARYRLNVLNENSASGIFIIKSYYKLCKN